MGCRIDPFDTKIGYIIAKTGFQPAFDQQSCDLLDGAGINLMMQDPPCKGPVKSSGIDIGKPRRSDTFFATLLLPAAAGPSMATTVFIDQRGAVRAARR